MPESFASKREEVIDLAAQRFLRRPFAKVGMESIARDVSVSTATLYILFPSKDDLFRVALLRLIETVLPQPAMLSPAEMSARSWIEATLKVFAATVAGSDYLALSRLMIAERARIGPELSDFYVQERWRRRAHSVAVFTAYAERGALNCESASQAVGEILSLVEGPLAYGQLLTGEDRAGEIEQICDRACALFFAKYGGPRLEEAGLLADVPVELGAPQQDLSLF